MKRFFYPVEDTTIYEQHERRNAGSDQILQLIKSVPNVPDEDGVIYEDTYNSRILMKFNEGEIQNEISRGKISKNSKYYLNLKATKAIEQPTSYTLEVKSLSQTWNNGRGYFNDYPEITEGASWTYRDGYYQETGTLWGTGSINLGTTASFATRPGGGTWHTGSNLSANYTFNYPVIPDARIEITSIVHAWLSGSISNNGILVKRTDSDEQSVDYIGTLNFFGVDTHTVYVPYLEVSWDDSILQSTGSLSEVGDSNFTVYVKNIRSDYKRSDKVRFRIGARDTYPTQTYSVTSNYLIEKRLPTSSYYAIKDSVTENYIIPFDTGSTKLSIDSKGSYFNFDMSTLLPERFYEIVLRIDQDYLNQSSTYEDGFYFKVVR